MGRAGSALARLRRRPLPQWWPDATLGIFVHWTPASVPGFAPTTGDANTLIASGRRDAFADMPYGEWYENSLKFVDSAVHRHHRQVYGDRPYRAFRDDWEAALEGWDPEAWATAFAATGAGYVVLVAKHTDGYSLWPTGVPHPHRPGWHSRRDVVGELGEAVRAAGMRFGLYYAGGMDWSFDGRPMGSMADVLAGIPQGAYPAYAAAQVRELVARYRPSVLWNDVAWPGRAEELWALLEHYYAEVPDGVVNDRWMPWSPVLGVAGTRLGGRVVDAVLAHQAASAGGLVPPAPPHFDVRTPEFTVFPEVQYVPFEVVRGFDHGFGFNRASRPDDFITRDDLLWLLVDVAAKGGNLLINVGPRGEDAVIPEPQAERLGWLSTWAGPRSHVLRGTRPWLAAGTPVGAADPVRLLCRGDVVYAVVRASGGTVTVGGAVATPGTAVVDASGAQVPWRTSPDGLVVDVPAGNGSGPVVLELRGVARRPADGGAVSAPSSDDPSAQVSGR